MTGFKNFLLRGNLVDIAVAVIIGTAFAAVVTTFTDWLTGLLPGRRRRRASATTRSTFGAFLNAVIAFVILAAVVYFFVVMPYTEAKEKFFPSPAPGTPEDIELLTGDPRPARRAARRPITRPRPSRAVPPHPWWGGTWDFSQRPRWHRVVVRARGVPLVAGGVGQHVAEDRGQPTAALPASVSSSLCSCAEPGVLARVVGRPRPGALRPSLGDSVPLGAGSAGGALSSRPGRRRR